MISLKRSLQFLFATSALLCIGSAQASSYMGYIQSVAQIGNRVFVYVNGGWWGTDNCGSGRSSLIVYADTSTADGRTFIALATAAKLSGNQVYVSGNGDCWAGNTPNGGTSESFNTMWLE